MKRLLEYSGFEPGRFHARWVSGSEGQKWADTCKEVADKIQALGPNKKMRDER